NDKVKHGGDMFETVDSVLDGLLGGVVAQMPGDDKAAFMSFLNDLAPHRSAGTSVDLQRCHLPGNHVCHDCRHPTGVADRQSDVAMDRWVCIEEETRREHARTAFGTCLGKMGD